MLKPLIALLFLAQTLFAQSVSQADSKAWMIQHFNIPAAAEITYFFSSGDPAKVASISWRIDNASHTRSYDFRTQAVTLQIDL